MKILIAQLETNIKSNKKATCQPDCQAKNIDGCIAQIFVEASGGY
jgi:hypothetical protein